MVLSVLHGIIRTTFGYGQSENPKHIIETKQEPVLASQVWGKLTRLFIVIRRLRESDIAKIETNSRTKKNKNRLGNRGGVIQKRIRNEAIRNGTTEPNTFEDIRNKFHMTTAEVAKSTTWG